MPYEKPLHCHKAQSGAVLQHLTLSCISWDFLVLADSELLMQKEEHFASFFLV